MMKFANISKIYCILSLFAALALCSGGFAVPAAAQEADGMFESDGLSCHTLMPLMRAFARAHVSDATIDSGLIDNTADQFVKRIDPSKNLLFESDVKNFENVVRDFMKSSRIPDCTKLHGLLEILVARSQCQLEFAKRSL